MAKDKAKEVVSNGQTSLSSFFSQAPSQPQPSNNTKRKATVQIDLTLSSDDDEDLVQPKTASSHVDKKPKLVSAPSLPAQPIASTSKLPPPPQLPPSKLAKLKVSAADRVAHWRFDPSSSTAVATPPSPDATARRDKFAAKLLGRKIGRTSGYLQKDHYLSAKHGQSGNSSTSYAEDDEGPGDDGDASEESDEERPSQFGGKLAKFANKNGKGDSSSTAGMGKPGVKYTPMELQVLALRKANPGIILMIETGYKYRFFQEDAQIASKVLGIACFPAKHFLTASIPTHRLNVHVKRLINAGHKVGVVTQQETAALKKISANKSGPFTRSVSAIYTASTFIDELSVDPLESLGSATSTLVCLIEDKVGKDDSKVRFGLVAVMPSTGEVTYDDFEDGHMRSELETRMLHLQPQELILPKSMTKQTESMLSYLTGQNTGIDDMQCRIERVAKLKSTEQAYSFVTDFYAKAEMKKGKRAASVKGKGKEKEVVELEPIVLDDEDEGDNHSPAATHSILDVLPKTTTVALAALIQHLRAFSLESVFLHRNSFKHFSNRAMMTLNGNTLANLEVLVNQTDFKERGSLMSIVDHCKTGFGRRLLRKWVSKPLVSLPAVQERLDAVTEILNRPSSPTITKLRELFRGLPDLERGLVRVHFGKASPVELLRVLEALQKISAVFEASPPSDDEDGMGQMRNRMGSRPLPRGVEVEAVLLQRIAVALPAIREVVEGFLEEIDPAMAREGNKADLFRDPSLFEAVQEAKNRLSAIDDDLQEELHNCRKLVKIPTLKFVQVSQEEYLLEVPIAVAKKLVPDNWTRVNATKSVHRYRSPAIIKRVAELEQCRETLAAEADKAFKAYLARVSASYDAFHTVVNHVATADCLFSLAAVANLPGYVRPTFSEKPGTLKIEAGRHPMVETLRESFVPNDVAFGDGQPKQMILTGLNMGGKSTASRSIALIALMAQIGSYVPADSVESSIFDGIYTRMGASDDLARARSTFMVELSETSEILKLATPRSLVLLDELGRGTSTGDGIAIASAVLEHIVSEIDCICLFVTHYPSMQQIARKHPSKVTLAHMSCLEENDTITFLYKLQAGLASRSHGLNVARLANLPESVLKKAKEKADELEKIMDARQARRVALRGLSILKALAMTGSAEDGMDEADVISLAHQHLLD